MGSEVGALVVGTLDGASLGKAEGNAVGALLGPAEGIEVGAKVGASVGIEVVGTADGAKVGA